jgi:hypothetical protein
MGSGEQEDNLMEKWEYRIILRKLPLMEIEMKRIGEEGWELCAILREQRMFDEALLYYFKKPVKINEE